MESKRGMIRRKESRVRDTRTKLKLWRDGSKVGKGHRKKIEQEKDR